MENTTCNYQIYHKEVNPNEIVLTGNAQPQVVFLVWFFGIPVTIWVAGMSKIWVSGIYSWLIFFIGIGITYMIALHLQNQYNEDEKANIFKNTTQQNINTAQNDSKKLNNILKVSNGLAQGLPDLLKKASVSLERAKIEFSSNAFSPYWDCIEQATRHLATFNNNIKQIRNYADQYYEILHDKKHNFPSFFSECGIFPDSVPIINELNVVVRSGLTNFQFATIWEHRKTQNILVHGFGTLGEAISNMATSIGLSISQLHDAISSNTVQMIDQQIMSRESFDHYSNNHSHLMKDQIKRLESINRKLE